MHDVDFQVFEANRNAAYGEQSSEVVEHFNISRHALIAPLQDVTFGDKLRLFDVVQRHQHVGVFTNATHEVFDVDKQREAGCLSMCVSLGKLQNSSYVKAFPLRLCCTQMPKQCNFENLHCPFRPEFAASPICAETKKMWVRKRFIKRTPQFLSFPFVKWKLPRTTLDAQPIGTKILSEVRNETNLDRAERQDKP